MKGKRVLIVFCVLMVLSALYSSVQRYRADQLRYEQVDVPESRFAPRQRPVAERNPARTFGTAIADAVEKMMPSVVVIRTERMQPKLKPRRLGIFGFDSYELVPERLAGEGSGVIVDERGYVITSWHVLKGARQVDVVLNDGTMMSAQYVGHDTASDLAVLKIKAEGATCPAAEFGDSDAVRVGEVAIAIGSPFSLQSSVTVGHVSQKGRRVKVLPYEDFIQTDAAMNEGNSGGALIDADGRLIGINAAIQTDAQQQGVGIGFAVPSNLAMVIANSLIETGRHEWPWVGAYFSTINVAYRKQFLEGAGVVVTRVFDDTPAARAGLLPGDIILLVDGVAVGDEQGIKRVVYHHAVGDTITFKVLRDESQLSFDLTLEGFPGSVD